ncbi:hypothetical protein [Ancylobacter lacus]|uniref:hypothetical protein n=1 Tax=Ancylobacter lacus TaxID=2579970 RepID=UPI001BCE96CD|nr:hypothetical protein [Ancylobacter lacus]MBS7537380.1 hypothetical protein [Ancylobacter lacus]
MSDWLHLALAATGGVALVAGLRFWRRRGRPEAPAISVRLQGTGVDGWWTVRVEMQGRGGSAWEAFEIHVREPEDACIISVRDAMQSGLATGPNNGRTVFEEIDVIRLPGRAPMTLSTTADDSEANESVLVYTRPAVEARPLSMVVKIRPAGSTGPIIEAPIAATLQADA